MSHHNEMINEKILSRKIAFWDSQYYEEMRSIIF